MSGLRCAPYTWSIVHWRRLTGVVGLGVSAWSIVHMLAVIPVVSSSRTVDWVYVHRAQTVIVEVCSPAGKRGSLGPPSVLLPSD